MSFGRRLALFFVLIAVVPTLALVGMLLIVSEDSRRGKADARLAAGLETALAVYEDDAGDGRALTENLATDPALAAAIRGGDSAALERFAASAARGPAVTAVRIEDTGGEVLTEAGAENAIAFGRTRLSDSGELIGSVAASTTTGEQYAAEVERLTKRELVVSRGDGVVGATVTPPSEGVAPGETQDVVAGGEFRAHRLTLSAADGESVLLLGPRKEGGFITVERPVAVLLTGFLLLGIVFAYALARTLTGLHTRVAEQAVTDPLTGLSNRRLMQRMLTAEAQRARRFDHKLSVLVLDVDDFKKINDESGHQQGDDVLRRIADIVREATRSIDIAARYGGDELALVLLETDATGAVTLAERLRSRVDEARIPARGGGETHVTVTIGTATMPDSAIDADGLIEAADQALLRAKRTGKNRVASAPESDGGRAAAGS